MRRNLWRISCTMAAAAVALAGCVPAAGPSAAPSTRDCAKNEMKTLYAGIFTFGTDQPVYPPWYLGDDPANGEGFESALAYGIAGKLGYARHEVRWVRVPFNAALAAGPKTFDANLSEFSITEQRSAAVDFSTPYFDVTQAVVTVESSPAAGVRELDDLRDLRLGVQVGSTSHSAAASVPGSVEVYNTNSDAKLALRNGEIDALVADLPTAIAVADELRGGLIVGRLPAESSAVEQFGVLLDKDSPLTRCVSWAVEALRDDGTLADLERRWLADGGQTPELA